MTHDPAIIAEARALAEQDRGAFNADMSDIERNELLRKLQRRLRYNLRNIRDSEIRNLYARHEALLEKYNNALRQVVAEQTTPTEAIQGLQRN
jgi:hypothetical protein